MAVDLFRQYYEETEYYDLLNEYNMHVSDFKRVFYQLLRNAVYNVDSLQQENTPFELDEGEKVEARIFDLQKCCDMLLPGVNDFDVTVSYGMMMMRMTIVISSALRTKLVYTRFNYSCRLLFSISLSIIPLRIYLLVDVKIVINMPSCMYSDYH